MNARQRKIAAISKWAEDHHSIEASDIRILLCMIQDDEVEVDRLRAELAETRAAGDKLAQVASEIYAFTSTDAHRDLDRARLIAQVRTWESVR